MSEILVIVPPEWSPVSFDEINSIVGLPLDYYRSGFSVTDINDRLGAWLPTGQCVIDVLVINDELYFKYGPKD